MYFYFNLELGKLTRKCFGVIGMIPRPKQAAQTW